MIGTDAQAYSFLAYVDAATTNSKRSTVWSVVWNWGVEEVFNQLINFLCSGGQEEGFWSLQDQIEL
jgi:hypothetical protein